MSYAYSQTVNGTVFFIRYIDGEYTKEQDDAAWAEFCELYPADSYMESNMSPIYEAEYNI